ncbi:MAG TPA: STAS domain-containing protein [Burkholderiales bacterium]
MIKRDGNRLALSGAVTLATVAEVLAEGRRHLDEGRRRQDEGVRVIDLAGVTEMDSALLALLLAWLRDARQRERTLEIANPPESLRTIARLYGVDEVLAGVGGQPAAESPAARSR